MRVCCVCVCMRACAGVCVCEREGWWRGAGVVGWWWWWGSMSLFFSPVVRAATRVGFSVLVCADVS